MNKEMKHDDMLDTEIMILGQDADSPTPTPDNPTSAPDSPTTAPDAQPPANDGPTAAPDIANTTSAPAATPHHHHWGRLVVASLTAGIIAAGAVWWLTRGDKEVVNIYNQKVVAETVPADSTTVETTIEEPIAGPVFVTKGEAMVNDVSLNIYTPHGGHMRLYVGTRPDTIPGLLCAIQAADVRADVDMPVGAFVKDGEAISRGSAKAGFCAVIADSITIGRDAETPLLERAIEQKGQFFRQFSLVAGGEVTDDGPKGKSLRRALCIVDGTVTCIDCTSRESYHDFAQALVDYGASEAIAMVGGNSIIFWRPKKGAPLEMRGKREGLTYKHCNFLIWTE